MVTKELNTKRYCCFYVSEFHLEMILLPYIRKNIDNSKIIIFTQENLVDTIRILLDRINFTLEEKNKILDLHYWDNKKIEEILPKKEDEYIFIINGNVKYIEEINKKITSFNLKKVSIVDCYNAEKINLNDINKKYDYKLNTEEV